MKVHVAAATHVGKVRTENQDAVVVGQWVTQSSGTVRAEDGLEPGARPVVLAVLDGMGGHAGGALASVLAAHAVATGAATLPADPEPTQLHAVVEAAAAAVASIADAVPQLGEMGTTLATVAIGAEHVDVLNVGDCRVSRLQDDYLGLLSVDDRVPDPTGVRASLLSQVLSGGRDRSIDPHHYRVRVDVPTTLLLCSDGLHDVVDDTATATALRGAEEPGGPLRSAQELVRLALEGGAPDNVSVLVVRLEPAAVPTA